MISQANVSTATPMGANLIAGGATFRAWAPAAVAVYVNGDFGGIDARSKDGSTDFLMARDDRGYWFGIRPRRNGRRSLQVLRRRNGQLGLQA